MLAVQVSMLLCPGLWKSVADNFTVYHCAQYVSDKDTLPAKRLVMKPLSIPENMPSSLLHAVQHREEGQ